MITGEVFPSVKPNTCRALSSFPGYCENPIADKLNPHDQAWIFRFNLPAGQYCRDCVRGIGRENKVCINAISRHTDRFALPGRPLLARPIERTHPAGSFKNFFVECPQGILDAG
jgi:hypothetical protein